MSGVRRKAQRAQCSTQEDKRTHWNRVRLCPSTDFPGMPSHALRSTEKRQPNAQPHNVMVVNRGDRRDFVKVVDFGIARSMDAAPGRHTASGAVIGTPAYMSPEQAAGDPTIDTRSDIFSLAVMVFHMLSGKIPFADKAKTPIEQLVQRATMREPIGRGTLRAQGNITPEIEAALLHALDPDRSRRPQTAGDFYRALEKAAAA